MSEETEYPANARGTYYALSLPLSIEDAGSFGYCEDDVLGEIRIRSEPVKPKLRTDGSLSQLTLKSTLVEKIKRTLTVINLAGNHIIKLEATVEVASS